MHNRKNFHYIRKVKIWFQSTMFEDHSSGLCMSVHRKNINLNKEIFIEDVINDFGTNINFYFLITEPNNILYYICVYAPLKI